MDEQYIDYRNLQQHYGRLLARVAADASLSERNRELLLAFVRDAALGKTAPGRARTRIGLSRRMSYIRHLRPLIAFLGMDLDKVQQADMERFIEALDGDQVRSQAGRLAGQTVAPAGEKLSPRYKADIKVTIKKFYKWLWGQSKTYPPLVEWIDTYAEAKEIPALTEAQVQSILDHCRTPVQRALVQVLFDGGFRIGELLNVRLRHVVCRALDPTRPSARCFVIRVPFSKTLRRTVGLFLPTTTRLLNAWLAEHPARPVVEADGTLRSDDPEAQLFPLSDNAVRLLVRRAGQRALGMATFPHLLRHTSATYWSNRLPYFKFCKRFGWTMTSRMPQRYIDRDGVDELSVALAIQSAETERYERETDELRALVAATSTVPVDDDSSGTRNPAERHTRGGRSVVAGGRLAA